MRRTYIVTYDICDDKRLRKVFKTCKGYGEHLQYSVFECDLSPTEKAEMHDKLHQIIHHEQDQILFIDLGATTHRGERTITALGKTYTKLDSPCFIF